MEIEELLLKQIDPLPGDIEWVRQCLSQFLQGHLAIPAERPCNYPCFVQERGVLYLQKTYKQETKVLNGLRQLIQSGVEPVPCSRLPLNPEQQRAVEIACRSNLTLLTGGPGTGKTYTAGYIIRTLGNCPFVLAAPTGKACAQLKSSIEACCDRSQLPPFRIATLHTLLETSKEIRLPLIPEELVLVDEASMIDIDLFGELLSKMRPGSRLILLGDPFQLPPVETPSLFPDLADLGDRLGIHAHLTECLRIENRLILHQANHLLQGRVTFPIHPLQDFHWDPSLDALLTPLKKGPYGSDHLNAQFFEQVLKSGSDPLNIPILITANDFSLQLFNGETGHLTFRRSDWNGTLRTTKNAMASFFIDGELRHFPAYELPPFDLAFALSIHKSQGSSYPHPILLLPPGTQNFGRELLYTAFTRAKHAITVYGLRDAVERTLSQSSRRQTGLLARWT